MPIISSRTMSSKTQRTLYNYYSQPTQESSPSKRKTQEPSAINPNQANPVIPKSIIEQLGNVNSTVNVVKKPRMTIHRMKITTADESFAEVKKKADESAAELRKKAADFDPQRAAFWGKGEKVPFMFVAKGLDAISKVSGRIAITEIVCNMLRTVIETTPEDLVEMVYLLAKKIAPAHEGLELGIGDSFMKKALAEHYGTTDTDIDLKYQELGDLGLVAKACRSSQHRLCKPQALTVAKVLHAFRGIAKESGTDSQGKKKKRINTLLHAATDCERHYLICLLTKLRIGLAEQTLLAALGHAAVYVEEQSLPPASTGSRLEEAAKILKQVYSVIPVYDKIVSALLSSGVWDLPKKCSFTLGVPVGPMLAKPINAVTKILEKFQNMQFTCEYKYDGERAQIHYMENGSVEIYSRNAERNTGKYPDVVAAISRLKMPFVTSFVLDCEIVAYDREKKKILPFQRLSTRGRKNVVTSEIKVDVCIFAFDILHVNGQSLLKEQLKIRRQHLYKSFEEETGVFQFAVAITSNDVQAIKKFLDASIDSSCEGLIIKKLDKDATYEPSSYNWLKLKKDYMDNIGDSLDLVPIGGFYGQGKRTGVYGAFLLACYDCNEEKFQSICKVGTGFSDIEIEERFISLHLKIIPSPKSYYWYLDKDKVTPDVWFEPVEVWEVKAAELTLSEDYCAATGIVDQNKGISLRFPRMLRVREDKSPEDATSSEMIAEMFSNQGKKIQEKQVVEDDE